METSWNAEQRGCTLKGTFAHSDGIAMLCVLLYIYSIALPRSLRGGLVSVILVLAHTHTRRRSWLSAIKLSQKIPEVTKDMQLLSALDHIHPNHFHLHAPNPVFWNGPPHPNTVRTINHPFGFAPASRRRWVECVWDGNVEKRSYYPAKVPCSLMQSSLLSRWPGSLSSIWGKVRCRSQWVTKS